MKKIIYFISAFFIIISQNVNGDIYKYTSSDGVLHFTDSPRTLNPSEKEVFDVQLESFEDNNEKYLFKNLEFNNSVELATYSVFTIMAGKRSGSAFFITENGHILTNRHVLRGKRVFYESIETNYHEYIKKYESNIKYLKNKEKRLDDELSLFNAIYEDKKKVVKKNLNELKEKKKAVIININKNIKILKAIDFIIKSRLGYAKDIDYKKEYKIILKNGKVLDIKLINESYSNDLALLKLDGYITPYLKPENNYLVGDEVYAIGTPGGVKDFVSRGNIIGVAQGFVKSNAKIYPGSSGGPLVNISGAFVGINTCGGLAGNKKIGYAIPVESILDDFNIEFLR